MTVTTIQVAPVSLADIQITRRSLPDWVHPEVHFWYGEWEMIRDCVAGEKNVKERTTEYLPSLSDMAADEYAAYLDRACFYNFSGRTVEALTGSIMRRSPVIDELPERLKDRLSTMTADGLSFDLLSIHTVQEVVQMGRVGVLIDYPAGENTDPTAYFATYIAENILDWETRLEGNELIPTRIVLREAKRVKTPTNAVGNSDVPIRSQFAPRYRELVLERDEGLGREVYRQYVYEKLNAHDEAFDLIPENIVDVITPTRQGEALERIPFFLIGGKMSSWRVEKPPLQDISRLNISHYKSYAHLEHGRFFTGFPIYYVEDPQGAAGGSADFRLGSSHVWITPPGAKPGLLELNGQGLKFLADALDQKEQQAASIGGRMIGIRPQAVAESDNQLKLNERNEQSVLLQIAKAHDEQMTKIMREWVWMNGFSRSAADKVIVEYNKDFLLDATGAREFRAIHSMYMDGVMPIEVVYSYFRKHEVIPDWMKEDEFKALLESKASFPNQPDVEAKHDGFPNKQSEIDEDAREEEAKRAEEAAKRIAESGGGGGPIDPNDQNGNNPGGGNPAA